MASVFPEKKSNGGGSLDLGNRATGYAHRLRLVALMAKLGPVKKDFCALDITESGLNPDTKTLLMDMAQGAHLLRDKNYELENTAAGSKEHQGTLSHLAQFGDQLEKMGSVILLDEKLKQPEKAKIVNALIYISDLSHGRVQLMGRDANRHE